MTRWAVWASQPPITAAASITRRSVRPRVPALDLAPGRRVAMGHHAPAGTLPAVPRKTYKVFVASLTT